MTQHELKRLVARSAVAYVLPGSVIGVGSGSTVHQFIEALAASRIPIEGAVSSGEATSTRLRAHGFRVLEANSLERIPLYIDGADEIDPGGRMIKGGGGALTREKIVADLADRILCIVDESKLVPVLGLFPLPIEVIPMAAGQIERRLRGLGGLPAVRRGFVTDNGCPIIDVSGLRIPDPLALEVEINQWPGVVSVGIFAHHKAHVCLLGTQRGVRTITFGDPVGPAASSA
ncbi:MAG: ribose-5-phosphate isomerase RpiA [Verrucomicrobiales bacterium]|nr:ribose-5-phosphate isomerase RpiA [Verrucomicrobiales bacterium]